MPKFGGQSLYSLNTHSLNLKHNIKEKIHFQWHSNNLKVDVVENKLFPAEEIPKSTLWSQETFQSYNVDKPKESALVL